jgi:hypothetical protein
MWDFVGKSRTRGARATSIGSLLVLGICICICSCSPGPERAGQRGVAITDGVTDTGHAPVGLILIGASGGKAKSICTGTIVGSKTVLTATHCLEVGENTLFQHDKTLYQVVKMIRRTDWDPSSSKYRKDIGLAVLDKVIPNAPMYTLASVAPTKSGAVTLVGFGTTADGVKDAGTKRKASNTIAAVQSDYFTITGTGSGVGNACQGDSGGPVLATVSGKTQILGVISASNAPCGSKSFHVRVDVFRSWLVQQAAGDIGGGGDTEQPTISIDAPTDGATVPAAFTLEVSATDNVGVVSVDVEVDGKASGSDSAAPYAFPLTLAAGSRTVKATAVDAAGNSASATVQVTVGGGPAPDGGAAADGAATADLGGPGGFGDPCGAARSCAGGLLCRADDNGAEFCTQACVVGYASCPDGSECVRLNGEEICSKPAAKPGGGAEDGCAVGSASTPGAAPTTLWLLGLWLLVRARRRGRGR